MGWNEDNTKAGYEAANKVPNRNSVIVNAQNFQSLTKRLLISFCTRLEKAGSVNRNIAIPMMIAIIFRKNDSDRNCRISWNLPAPTTFLTPTSFDRSRECAVERLT